MPSPSQNSVSASPASSAAAVIFLGLAFRMDPTWYGGRTASYRHDRRASRTSARITSTGIRTPIVTWRPG